MNNESFSKDIQALLDDLSNPSYITDKFEDIRVNELIILKGVFRADKSYLGGYIAHFLSQNRNVYKDKDVLDLGSGCGLLGLVCALNGAKSVSYSDINYRAIINSKLNTLLHNVFDNSSFHHGNLFDPISDNTKYDLIIFNPPSITGVPKSESEYALIRDDEVIFKFYNSYKKHLKENGFVIMPGSTRFDSELSPRNMAESLHQDYKFIEKVEDNEYFKYILTFK